MSHHVAQRDAAGERVALAKVMTGSTLGQLMFDFALWSSRACRIGISTRIWNAAP